MSSIFHNLQQNTNEMKPRKCFFSNCNNVEEDNPNPDALTLKVYSQSKSQKLKSVYCCPKHSKPSSVTLKIPPINQPPNQPPQVQSVEKKLSRITADTQMNEICRLCLKSLDITTADKSFAPIFGEKTVILNSKREIVDPSQLITTFTDMSVTELQHNLFPQQICKNCFRNLCAMEKFRKMCAQTHETLIKAIIKNEEPNYEPDELIEIEVVSDIEDEVNADENIEVDGIVEESESDAEPIIPYLEPQLCQLCNDIFDSCEEMKYHRMARHENTFIYKCYVGNCKKVFKRIEPLQKHHETHHPSGPSFQCDVCKKVFFCYKGYKGHIARHGERKHHCTICKKSFVDRSALSTHELVHNGRRNFLCDVCSKAFQTPYTLKVHKRIHTNEKPFICHLCAEAFAYKCLMNSHLAKYHPNEPIEKVVI